MEDERGWGGASLPCLTLHPSSSIARGFGDLVFVRGYVVFHFLSRAVMTRLSVRPLACLALVAGCGRGLPVAEVPAGTPAAVVPVDRLAPPWRMSDTRRVRAQRIQVSAVITSRVDSVVRTDSVASELAVSWGDDARASDAPLPVRVTRYVVRVAPDTTWRVPPGLLSPFALTATPSRGAVPVLCASTSAECSAAHIAAAQGWQESWIGAPAVLEPGAQWRDSTAYIMMRDSIPLAVTSVREFTVREAVLREGRVVLVVDRRSTQRLAGEGQQFGEAVRITGSGEGVMRLEVALASGAVVRGDGTAVLTLRLVGRRRTQDLTQESHITITAP